jgi:hypothetical protein
MGCLRPKVEAAPGAGVGRGTAGGADKGIEAKE